MPPSGCIMIPRVRVDVLSSLDQQMTRQSCTIHGRMPGWEDIQRQPPASPSVRRRRFVSGFPQMAPLRCCAECRVRRRIVNRNKCALGHSSGRLMPEAAIHSQTGPDPAPFLRCVCSGGQQQNPGLSMREGLRRTLSASTPLV